MEKKTRVFSFVQPFKDFVLKHGKIYREEWRRRLTDDKPFRIVHFEDSCKAIAIHQLDGLSIDELTNLSSLKIGHFINGGYAIYLSWVEPSEWENVNLSSSDGPSKGYDCDDFVIYSNNGRQGLSLKDGTIVIDPLFSSITLNRERNFLAYSKISETYIELFPRTYGEGLICCEKYDKVKRMECGRLIYGWPNIQYFMNRYGEQIITFDSAWFDKNDIPILCCPIGYSEICFFKDGFLVIEIRDGDSGYKYKVDRSGHAEYVSGNYYGSEEADLLNDMNYDGYEELEYWSIQDQGLRDGLDDDPEACGNID